MRQARKLVRRQEARRQADAVQRRPEAVARAMRNIPGLKLQPTEEQREYKVSYFVDPVKAPGIRDIVRRLRQKDIHINAIYSHDAYLDFLPVRASKGAA